MDLPDPDDNRDEEFKLAASANAMLKLKAIENFMANELGVCNE